MIYKYGWERFTLHSLREHDEEGKPKVRYGVRLWKQPLRLWLVARVYHWYDMRVFKLPGFKLLENWLENRYYKRHPSEDDILLYVPLSCQQDIRCYHLGEKKRETLATFDIDKEQYDKLRRRDGALA